MRIEIEIPKEYEDDYNADRFSDFFSRAMIDIETMQGMCGRYEIETAKMLLNAFKESKEALNPEAIISELDRQAKQYHRRAEEHKEYDAYNTVFSGKALSYEHSIEIVQNNGKS